MKDLFIFLICLFLISTLKSQIKNEENAIKTSIHTFFEGLQKGDTILLNSVINKNLKLQTAFLNNEGRGILRNETRKAFLTAISSKNPNDIWMEKLLSYDIKIDGNLASVWTPYKFYFNNEFSHCGVNSFQLFKNGNIWEIIYIVDTRRKNCN
ncbi:nuclear transport factor 2 family protein [Lutibacter flavus]|uniref:Putative lumazine-binding n=1 Tax=Lutibacter flavus TaxID=691689 RepID=A0A238X6Z5_9FLAO|nr:nuclear transport factor 2 family protein [Lutibacter flavus]SNR54402.1 Putative lumazine-binding [Lutibacter flavus]